jgi:hypothetical protein
MQTLMMAKTLSPSVFGQSCSRRSKPLSRSLVKEHVSYPSDVSVFVDCIVDELELELDVAEARILNLPSE